LPTKARIHIAPGPWQYHYSWAWDRLPASGGLARLWRACPPAQLNAVVFNIQSGLNFYPVAPEDGTGVSKKTSVAYLTGV